MKSFLCSAAACVAMVLGADLLAPSPELFSPAYWREAFFAAFSFTFGLFYAERE